MLRFSLSDLSRFALLTLCAFGLPGVAISQQGNAQPAASAGVDAEDPAAAPEAIVVPVSLSLATQLLRKGKPREALAVLSLLRNDPNADLATIELLSAVVELSLKQPQAAAARLLALLQEYPGLIPAQQQLARALMHLQKTDEALAILQELKDQPQADQTEVEFLLGLGALKNKNYAQAAKHFREILTNRPQEIRVRLELARALFLSGEDESARYHFEYVLATKPPEGVQPTVQRFLDAIRARRGWQLHIGMGISPDTNINSAPSNESIRIGDLLFDLDPDSQKRSGIGLTWEAAALWRHPLSQNWQLVTRGIGNQRNYKGSVADDTIARTSLGLRWLRPGSATDLTALVGRRWLSSSPYNYEFGLELANEHRLLRNLSLRENAQLLKRRYRNNFRANGYVFYTAGALSFGLDPVSTMDLNLAFARTIANSGHFSSSSPSIAAGIQREFKFGISARIGVRYAHTRYDSATALGGVRRNEKRTTFTLTLRKRDWNLFGLTPEISIDRERNLSNVEFYRYRRTQFNLGVSKQF